MFRIKIACYLRDLYVKTSNGLKIDFVTLHDLSSITVIIKRLTETQTILFHDDYNQT